MDVGGRWNKGIGGPLALENPQLGRKPELAPEQSLMDGINAGRKTIHFARFDKTRTAQGLESLRSYRTEWDEKSASLQEDARPQLGLARRRWMAMPVSVVARADARAGAGEGPHSGPHARDA